MTETSSFTVMHMDRNHPGFGSISSFIVSSIQRSFVVVDVEHYLRSFGLMHFSAFVLDSLLSYLLMPTVVAREYSDHPCL